PAPGEMGDLVRAFNGMVEELDAQQRELARLERLAAWRDLARTLAHEIKNPLTPIQLAIQQLGDQTPPGGDPAYATLVNDCVEIVNEEVEALRRLVREFSEFARLPQPQPAGGDLAALLEDLSRLYGERLACRPAATALPAVYDEGELRRALINLIDNGIAACREAGRAERVEIAASLAADGAAVLRVTDDGNGVPEANRERIFEPDFSTKSGGMGLGLAIVDGIVRGHGGTITLEEGAGRGAAFTIRLPAAETEAPGAPAAATDGGER
ncbi:GHKL domain-containing protein, partial [bacterium]|nr:GHKL domain-containing protein [bacterium]